MNQCMHLIRLAEGWRTKADRLQKTYGKAAPNAVLHTATALETCAAELEEELRRVLVEVPKEAEEAKEA